MCKSVLVFPSHVALLFSLSDLIPKFGHFFHLNIALGSFAQLVHVVGGLFCTDCLRTCRAVERGAWNAMLTLD